MHKSPDSNIVNLNATETNNGKRRPTPASNKNEKAPANQFDLVELGCTISGKVILQNINISLKPHGISAIMGFNGAGKSMLLKLIHGIATPTNGHVRWNQQVPTREHRLNQAMVFQKPVLLRRSVKANIDFVIKQRKHRDPLNRNALLAMVGLVDKATQAARLLSGGEQQRLALARALACKPSVLFLDEATASLDSASAAIIEDIVERESRAGTKIIMVTHDAAQAARLSDEVIFMHGGTVVEHSNSQSFFTTPSSAPAKAYLEGRLYNPNR